MSPIDLPPPLVTAELPGTGGRIKVEPSHFVVEEIPLYEPAGDGHHVYVRLTREGWTTKRLLDELSALFGLRLVDIGCAGLKDKHARATQTFSLLLQKASLEDVRARIEGSLPVTDVTVRRHLNKLKKGHLLGNRFRIVVQDTEADALARARAVAAALEGHGWPNFYGAQRFGINGDNAARGREALEGRGPQKRWLRRFLLSAYQAGLFNRWLEARLKRGWFDRLLTGDIAKKSDTGGLFEVEEAERESPRFERAEITYTGPIYGYEMKWAAGEPGALEHEILESEKVTKEMMRRSHLSGTRRPGRLFLKELAIEEDPAGLRFTFILPKGAYATTVLREFMKVDVDLPES